MTAIAAILKGGSQVIISDMLVSAPGAAADKDQIYIPTGLTSVDDLGNQHPSGFAQKAIIISPSLVFAWTGRWIFGSWACRHLREHYADYTSIDAPTLERIVDELSAECGDTNGFMVSTYDAETRLLQLKHKGGWWGHVDGVCDMMLAGSGGSHLYEAAEKLGEIPSSGIVQWAMVLVATMIEREVASRSSTIACYGAAWDIIYLAPEGFKKLDPVVYSQWLIEPHEDTFTYAMQCLVGTKYFEDRLSIKALINKADTNPALMYADAWPPSVGGKERRTSGPGEFKLDSPNQVFALKFKWPSQPPFVTYRVFTNADEQDRPFREKSSSRQQIDYDVQLSFFDEAFAKFRKGQR